MFEGEDDVRQMKAMQEAAEKAKREGLIRRFSQFLDSESGGDASHPAGAAKKALEAGSTAEAVMYLSSEIDKAAVAQDELRRGELMRWKTDLTKR